MNDRATDSAGQLAQIRDALRHARRHLRNQRLKAGLSRGVNSATTLLIPISIGLLAYTAYLGATGASWTPHLRILLGAAGLLVGTFLFRLVQAIAQKPTDSAVAQRVDAAAQNHNRIATAEDLLRTNNASPMALAAIEDGIAALRDAATPPLLDETRWHARRWLGKLAVAAVIWALLPLVVLALGRAKDIADKPTIASKVTPPTLESPADKPVDPKPAEANRPTNNTAESPAGIPNTNVPDAAPADAARMPLSSGSSSGASAGKSAGSDPTGATPQPKPSNQPLKPNADKVAKPSKSNGMGAGAQGDSTGGVGAGGKGGGGKTMGVENESRKQDAAELESGEDAGGDPADVDENNENRHRGGAQPILQDRAASPTRELGIGGAKGSPGNGRGGPTPTKKSRGAGALMLGVPIPDFIPGKLLAGTSKIARESIKPRRTDLPEPAPMLPAPRTTDEQIIDRFDVDVDLAPALTRYLAALHEAPHDNPPNTAATQPTVPVEGASVP